MDKRQQQLFGAASAAPWEADELADQLIASVVFAEGAEGQFDYLVPEGLRPHLEVGRRLTVPLGRSNRPVTGYCVAASQRAEVERHRLKEIHAVLDDVTLLSPGMLRLTRWLADYYLCGWGAAIETAIPAGVRTLAGTREATFLSVTPATEQRAREGKLSPIQQRALAHLAASKQPLTARQLAAAVGCSLSPIQQLRKRGLVVESTQRVVWGEMAERPCQPEKPWHPNPDQQQALERIQIALDANQPRTLLMLGVTGSGKTEVYIRAIEQVVRGGRQAIVLVPEISLTPQTEQRFRARFASVAVLHSHQSAAERHWHWRRIARGEVPVVVGARSAVFAPTPHLGLIVLDEEHDASFKQDSTPRYHAREVALQRCTQERVPLILGSATPSLESYQAALQGNYELLRLPRRVLDRPLPHVSTIDLRNEFQSRRLRGAISRPLHQAMHHALREGGQIILLLNRRGFSPTIQCPACGQVVKCPYCDITLTHHRDGAIAVCHYCDHQRPTPTTCPHCHSSGIRYLGLGTQRLEQEVRARFPQSSCLRMDSDSMKQHGSHEKALARFREGEIQILLGTQMIAKGLDFPNVTLVGVINSDVALHLPNFRSAERTFQLVTQVAGRTGRGEKGGRVLVQTFTPDHPAIVAATRHDYEAFTHGELPGRQRFHYPPFGAMIRIIVRGEHEPPVEQFAQRLSDLLAEQLPEPETRVAGPAPAPIAKLRGKYRHHLLLLGPDGERLRAAVRRVTAGLTCPEDLQWIADVDPLDML